VSGDAIKVWDVSAGTELLPKILNMGKAVSKFDSLLFVAAKNRSRSAAREEFQNVGIENGS
jgi:hypothetical protein